MIEVKEAIRVAEKYIQEVMPDFGMPKLEEIEFSEPFQAWLITFKAGVLPKSESSLSELLRPFSHTKVVQVSASDGKLIAIKNKAA
jgi:hypothetical protein